MDRKSVQKILTRHYDFRVPVSEIDQDLKLAKGTARSVIVQSWISETLSAVRIAKEM